MNIEIHSIVNNGDQTKEYVLLEVKEDCKLQYYMICDTTYTGDGKISNELRHTYWFPPKSVKKGDFIRLYTEDGKNNSLDNNGGSTTHNFYWNIGRPIWNDEKDRAVLFEINTWTSKSTK